MACDMIFVTVGTHEQQFNRLIECVDKLKEDGIIDEDVVMQIGYSTYEPKFCEWNKMYSYDDMTQYVNAARIVITHGGPSSFLMPLQVGKIPIVVPRKLEFDEHVNDHQLEFANAVVQRNKNIIVVDDISQIKDVIKNYDAIIDKMNRNVESNNKKFCVAFEKIVDDMMKK